jgi:hypothetical protein
MLWPLPNVPVALMAICATKWVCIESRQLGDLRDLASFASPTMVLTGGLFADLIPSLPQYPAIAI